MEGIGRIKEHMELGLDGIWEWVQEEWMEYGNGFRRNGVRDG